MKNAMLHELRFPFVINARGQEVTPACIKAITGHKTMAVFKCDNMVDKAELRAAIHLLESTTATNALEHTDSPGAIVYKPSRSRRSAAGRATDS
jgi:hypothetical protein